MKHIFQLDDPEGGRPLTVEVDTDIQYVTIVRSQTVAAWYKTEWIEEIARQIRSTYVQD